MKRKIGYTNKEAFILSWGPKSLSMGNRPSEKEAINIIHNAFDLGINFLDTANVYCSGLNEIGHNEILIGKAIKTYDNKKEILVTTKGGSRPEVKGGLDCSPNFLKASCEKSLKALGLDSIFIYQLHAIDPKIPFEESLQALIELKKEGKIQHIGLDNINIKELEIALKLTKIAIVQNKCNLFYKEDISNGLISFCKENDISYLPHSPFGGYKFHKETVANEILNTIANNYNTTPYVIMLSWLLQLETNVIPIFGASKITSFKENLKAIDILLNKDDLVKLN
ncbi:MAG: aldo/keto reductase [Candidatus Sericytochromatia bacterium]